MAKKVTKTSAELVAEMDAASITAEAQLSTLEQPVVLAVATWYRANFMKAGHKRLGRLLVKVAKADADAKKAAEKAAAIAAATPKDPEDVPL